MTQVPKPHFSKVATSVGTTAVTIAAASPGHVPEIHNLKIDAANTVTIRSNDGGSPVVTTDLFVTAGNVDTNGMAIRGLVGEAIEVVGSAAGANDIRCDGVYAEQYEGSRTSKHSKDTGTTAVELMARSTGAVPVVHGLFINSAGTVTIEKFDGTAATNMFRTTRNPALGGPLMIQGDPGDSIRVIAAAAGANHAWIAGQWVDQNAARSMESAYQEEATANNTTVRVVLRDLSQSRSVVTCLQVDDTPAGTAFVDQTDNFNSATAADLVLFPATEAAGDYAAFGMQVPFNGIDFDAAGGTAGVGGVVTWEYWNGTAWTALAGVQDRTTSFTIGTTDTQRVRWTVPTDWVPQRLNNSASLYYVRARITTVYTTNPVYDQGFVRVPQEAILTLMYVNAADAADQIAAITFDDDGAGANEAILLSASQGADASKKLAHRIAAGKILVLKNTSSAIATKIAHGFVQLEIIEREGTPHVA